MKNSIMLILLVTEHIFPTLLLPIVRLHIEEKRIRAEFLTLQSSLEKERMAAMKPLTRKGSISNRSLELWKISLGVREGEELLEGVQTVDLDLFLSIPIRTHLKQPRNHIGNQQHLPLGLNPEHVDNGRRDPCGASEDVFEVLKSGKQLTVFLQ